MEYSLPLNADMVLIMASVAAFMLGLLTGLIFWYRSKALLEKEKTDLRIRLTAEEKVSTSLLLDLYPAQRRKANSPRPLVPFHGDFGMPKARAYVGFKFVKTTLMGH